MVKTWIPDWTRWIEPAGQTKYKMCGTLRAGRQGPRNTLPTPVTNNLAGLSTRLSGAVADRPDIARRLYQGLS